MADPKVGECGLLCTIAKKLGFGEDGSDSGFAVRKMQCDKAAIEAQMSGEAFDQRACMAEGPKAMAFK